MKLGQLIEYNERNIFFKNYVENEAGRRVSDLVSFLEKLNMRLKKAVCSLISICFNSP